jgi:MoaA/NifB/PqqE/SkfB family radical SAM enzyme
MRLSGTEGAAVLLANQLAGIHILVSRGIMVKVNCVAIKGINDGHLDAVTKKVRELGAFMTNIMPHIAVTGSAFESLERLNNKELEQIRKSCEENIRQMRHCRQCRADAVGTLDDDQSIRFRKTAAASETHEPPRMHRVAVATKTGMIVDLHFGHAEEFHIYETDGTAVRFARSGMSRSTARERANATTRTAKSIVSFTRSKTVNMR